MRITINDVTTSMGITETYDIVNAIRNSSTESFRQYVPLANAENVAEVGAGILLTEAIQNDFITALVDRIGLVIIRAVSLKNPLKKFKKGRMPQGRTIEDIFVDITKSHKYDEEVAEDEVFKRDLPNVKTLFHERNRQEFYKQTINQDALAAAFTSWQRFGDFVAGIMNAMYNSAEVDEYEYMKLIIDNYYSKGLFAVEKVTDPVDQTSATQFVKQLRATAQKMTLPMGSRDYNALAVRTRTEMDNLHLIITADLNAEIDVDVLAKAFNMNKTDFMGHVTVIDNFASEGVKAVLVDYDWYMVYDNNLKMNSIYNPQGLYWNYFLHVWQTLSASRFQNAVAFVADTADVPPVTSVIVDPTISARKAGKTLQFTAYVRQTEPGDFPVVWSVEPSTSETTLDAGTTIDQNGLLTISDAQTGELKVKATATYTVDPDGTAGTGDEVDHDVVGEGLVSVIPA